MRKRKLAGKFWPYVRPLIWQKAQELYQFEQARALGSHGCERQQDDFTGVTATRKELREAGYFYEAKLIVLRDLWLQKKGLPTSEEEEFMYAIQS